MLRDGEYIPEKKKAARCIMRRHIVPPTNMGQGNTSLRWIVFAIHRFSPGI